uniref:(northern house mosquito) hypothetical protein n=1 Tax=Culex pipiens TaxID=7175 RepID=A0A8D8CUM7_CULPI
MGSGVLTSRSFTTVLSSRMMVVSACSISFGGSWWIRVSLYRSEAGSSAGVYVGDGILTCLDLTLELRFGRGSFFALSRIASIILSSVISPISDELSERSSSSLKIWLLFTVLGSWRLKLSLLNRSSDSREDSGVMPGSTGLSTGAGSANGFGLFEAGCSSWKYRPGLSK